MSQSSLHTFNQLQINGALRNSAEAAAWRCRPWAEVRLEVQQGAVGRGHGAQTDRWGAAAAQFKMAIERLAGMKVVK
jgi:hypothetical protein